MCLSVSALGQEFENLLDEVIIQGNNLRTFEQPWIEQEIDSLPVKTLNGSTFSNLLEQNSIAALRLRAGVSTASFRGLLSSHTQLLWNGIPLQSPSLGVVDLSTIPSSVYRNPKISIGGSSAMFGSGALGGTIHLEDRLKPIDGYQIGGGIRYGSFGLLGGNLGIGLGNSKGSISIDLYGTENRNEFSFENTAVLGRPIQTQENAGYSYKGLKLSGLQKLSKGVFFFNYWYHDGFQQIQGPITSQNRDDWQTTTNHRLIGGYRITGINNWVDVRAGYIEDQIDFNGSKTRTFLGNLKAEYGQTIGKRLNLIAGVDLKNRDAEISEYNKNPQEGIYGGYFSLEYSPDDRLRLGFTGRQTWWNGSCIPFTAEIQGSAIIARTEKSTLIFLAKGSNNYRIPTLNDLFWDPGGNPVTDPEKSLYGETGLSYSKRGKTSIFIRAMIFGTRVQDLITWIPMDSVWSSSSGGYINSPGWGVINQDELTSYGAEFSGDLQRDVSKEFGFGLAFSWSPVRSRGESSNTPYIPFQTGMLGAKINYKNLAIRYSLKFTGERATNVTDELMDPFTIQFLEMNYQMKFRTTTSNIFLRVDNLANASYQSIAGYAMPGRRFSIGLNFLINKK